MNGYFLQLARLALSRGSRIEPRSTPEWEGGWTETEGEDEAPAPVRTAETRPGPTLSAPGAVSIDASTSNAFSETTLNELHHHASHEETTIAPPASPTLERGEIRTTERLRSEIRETRESLRELVREAQTIRQDRLQESVRTEIERVREAIPTLQIERQREIQRLVREIETATRTQQIERINETRAEGAEPTVEIHIGRIDVRAPGPAPKKEERRERPKGVIGLEDYLRERSREGR